MAIDERPTASSTAASGDAAFASPPEPAGSRPAGDARDPRRVVVARAVLELLRGALPPDSDVELVLAGDPVGVMAVSGKGGAEAPATRVVVNGPDALGRILWPPSPDALAEAYLRGDLEIEGDVISAARAGREISVPRSPSQLRRLARGGLELRSGAAAARRLQRSARLTGRRHSRARDLEAVRFHYDVGNEFFRLWLDRRLTYSCAYFESGDRPEATLDAAQDAKLDLICRKLALQRGQRMLDIGGGWGSLVLFAAERYGVDATGVTLSEKQATFANSEAGRRGVDRSARMEVRDYRDLGPLGPFDAIASVGMFEHVGRERLSEYLGAAFDALKPGGLFLNHGIATASTVGRSVRLPRFRPGGFVERYVFPDGDLVTVDETVRRARGAGFEVLDLQSLRPHYALTLEAWVRRLEANADRARELAGDEVYRTWRLYMSAARQGFEEGSLDVAQLLLARPADGRPARLPLRPWW